MNSSVTILSEYVLVSEWTDFLVRERWALVSRYFTPVETGDSEVAVVYFDDKVSRVVGPGQRVLFWKGPVEVTYDLIDARENPQVPAVLVPAILRLGRESQATARRYRRGQARTAVPRRPTRARTRARNVRFLECSGLSACGRAGTAPADGRSSGAGDPHSGQGDCPSQHLRRRIRSSIAVAARSRVKDVCEHLYRTLQIAVRQTLGRGTLEELLADKVQVDDPVSAEVRREMEVYGVRVGEIALKDIILPGDIRDILNQVVTAEKQAQANLIRRREETAATRSLLNTAKLMEDNPLLVRLKELETLERVAEKVEKITVVDGLNGLLDGAVKLSR